MDIKQWHIHTCKILNIFFSNVPLYSCFPIKLQEKMRHTGKVIKVTFMMDYVDQIIQFEVDRDVLE